MHFKQKGLLYRSYEWMMAKATHPHAVWYMGLISFIESSFFPIPPDPLLVAMTLQNVRKAWQYALIATFASVAGGFLGYFIGYSFFEFAGKQIIDAYGFTDSFHAFKTTLNQWAFWAISIKGVTPIPYKVVTIAAGAAHVDLWTFTIASLIARGFRFLYVAAALRYFGTKIKDILDRYLTIIMIVTIAVLILGFFLLKWLF